MKQIFIDTNFIIDFLGERHPFYMNAAKIMTLSDRKEIKLYTSPLAISTSYYILAKYQNQQIAWEKIRKFKILCNISIMDDTVIEKALNSKFKDFEDALQYFSALASNCDCILTRNEKDFKLSLIPVLSPENYLSILNL